MALFNFPSTTSPGMPLVTLAMYDKLTEDSSDLRANSTANVTDSAGTSSASATLFNRAALNDSPDASSRLMPAKTLNGVDRTRLVLRHWKVFEIKCKLKGGQPLR
jgi:hypothetical protein